MNKLITLGLLFVIFGTCPQISYGEKMPSVMGIVSAHSLDLTDKQLTFLTNDFFNQIDLEKLWIDDNQISEIFVEIDRLVNLKRLSVYKNRLTA